MAGGGLFVWPDETRGAKGDGTGLESERARALGLTLFVLPDVQEEELTELLFIFYILDRNS